MKYCTKPLLLAVLVFVSFFSCKPAHDNFQTENLDDYLQGFDIIPSNGIVVIANERNCSTCRTYLEKFIEDNPDFIKAVIINTKYLKASVYLKRLRLLAENNNIGFYEDRGNLYEKNICTVTPYPVFLTFSKGRFKGFYELTTVDYDRIVESVLKDVTNGK